VSPKQSHDQRERLVCALLETLNDPYELPRHEPADAGPAPSKRVPCGVCQRTGKLIRDHRHGQTITPCGSCGGTGWRRKRKGDQEWDEYLNLPVSTAGAVLKTPQKAFKLDEDIRRLWFELQRLERMDEPDSDALLRALQAKDWLERRGSYAELRRALRVLEHRFPCVYGAVWRRYLRNVETEGSKRFLLHVEVGVAFPGPGDEGRGPRPHAWRQAESVRRVRSVEELAAEGLTAGQIARELGMPKRKVQRLLAPRVSADPPATV
jgi:hypothetical protein